MAAREMAHSLRTLDILGPIGRESVKFLMPPLRSVYALQSADQYHLRNLEIDWPTIRLIIMVCIFAITREAESWVGTVFTRGNITPHPVPTPSHSCEERYKDRRLFTPKHPFTTDDHASRCFPAIAQPVAAENACRTTLLCCLFANMAGR